MKRSDERFPTSYMAAPLTNHECCQQAQLRSIPNSMENHRGALRVDNGCVQYVEQWILALLWHAQRRRKPLC